MAKFEEAYAIHTKNEGGYQNGKGDKGGETYAGIARNFWPNWAGWPFIDNHKSLHGPINWNAKFPVLTPLVVDFFRVNFWNVMRGNEINSQSIANVLYDNFAGPAGAHGTAVQMQEALNSLGAKLLADGKIGPRTIAAINTAKQEDLHEAFKLKMSEYYHSKKYGKKLGAWLARLDSFVYLEPKKKELSA